MEVMPLKSHPERELFEFLGHLVEVGLSVGHW
jgi:hypothetical protein